MADNVTIHNVKRRRKPDALIAGPTQRLISLIAGGDFPVLLAGENGVGKRLVAEQIHLQSQRIRGSFTELQSADCNSESVLEALSVKGTVYLAEIANLSLDLQGLVVDTYFRFDQAHDCRLLCGTSRELLEQVQLRMMREDFFHLVSAFTIRIPPLRCRKSEILSIADELLTQYSRQFDRPRPVLRKDIIGFLTEHSWPGNLAELQTAIKTFVAIDDQSISLAALKAAASALKPNGHPKNPLLKEATRSASIQVERRLIAEVLAATGGNRKRAADELGISYKALLYKLKQVGTEFQPELNKSGVAI